MYPFQRLSNTWAVLITLTRQELRRTYAGSLMGTYWYSLYRLIFLGSYCVAYLYFARDRSPDAGAVGAERIFGVLATIIPYLAVTETIQAASTALFQGSQLIRGARLKVELLPLRSVLIALLGQLITICLLLIALAVLGELRPEALILLPALLVETVLLCGIAFFIAPLGALIPDIRIALPLLLYFIFFVAPVTQELSDINNPIVRQIMLFNPVYHMLLIFRNALIQGSLSSGQSWLIFILFSSAIFLTGYLSFARLKRALVDYV